MAELFVRRTTGFLLFLICLLCMGVVALLVLLLKDPSDNNNNNASVDATVGKPEKLKTQPWELEYRIPTTTVPVHYDLYLHPNLDTGKFSGRVSIQVAVTSPTSYLVTHAKDMNISRTRLRSIENDLEYDLMDYFEYEPNQFWVVRPKQQLNRGNYSLYLEFDGNLEDRIVGFYKSVYTNSDGEKRSIATSKFQPTDARGAFPCFDEPSFRSTFTVTLVMPSQGYIALSNMPEKSQTVNSPQRGLTEVLFQKSVPMVTYLACFIVCDFHKLEARTQDNKLFRVYATPHQTSRAQYSLDIGVSILNYFENYFEVEYPLPKQDMIAIPDFVSGAMEHWGLITYRETNLLYDALGSSSYNKQRVASVVSHELAHMWFGNLVTLSWWDDLWLNEGFASYIEYKGVAHYERDWDMLGQFLVLDLQPVMRLDAQLTSHPIIQAVEHPDQITEIFDSISYSKGASVLRMLDNFMGEEQFRTGIRNFLRSFKYGNAITSDLWRHLEETSSEGRNISSIMDTWTKQMGFPVLMVKRIKSGYLEVHQERFLQDPAAVSPDDSPYGYRWDIPVTARTDDASTPVFHWFFRDMPKLTVSYSSSASWVKLNADQYGYYRVNYEQSMWDDLITVMMDNHERLTPSDRSHLLDDAFTLAAAGQLSYTVPLRLASYLAREKHYIPWKTVASHISHIARLLRTHKAYPLYRQYVLQLVQQHTRRVGWDDSGNHLQRRLRPLLHSLACSAGSKGCLSTAQQQLQQLLHTNSPPPPPNLRDIVYKYGMKEAEYSDWAVLLERYGSEQNAQEKGKQMAGLTASSTPWIMHRFLDESRNISLVRAQDYLSGLIRAARNPAATDLVWNFIRSEWQFLVGRYTINNRYLGRTVKAVVSLFTTQQQLEDAEHWFTQEPEAGSGARARLQAVEEARKSINWIAQHGDTLHAWLLEHVQ